LENVLQSGVESKVMRGFVLGFFVFATSFTVAGGNTGMVLTFRGTVTAEISGERRPLQQGDHIFVNDRIVTGDKSFVVLQFMDGARVSLLANSAMVIEKYLYNETEQDAATLRLEAGGLRVVAGAMAKSNPGGYKVRTPVALMVVRGSKFAVMLCGNQICTEDETQN